ncbi:hypothetical protein AVEN_198221-1 [Araneus ventricosus]|uniref:Reverse transcriptase domain-containing protein n=1 Tax=Araneus ventricosus TaxID=182803 RepID=A0A4Y2SQ17_ARAVE|nr:hypothetical protein AVEN_198221-1 [Araneus ventricosus]
MREYKDLGHMTEVKEASESELSVYLPHHGMYNPLKSSTKLRVVFNGSFPTSNGISLNQIQLNGGTVRQDLFPIMLRFRKHEFVFTADICMMYRQILIHPDQRVLKRIVWKEGPDQPSKTYQLNTITYGTTSAPYLATRTLYQLEGDEKDTFPDASIIVHSDCYMDDILTGSISSENIKELQTQLVQLLGRGGMTLHKWCSNNETLLNNIQNSGDCQFNNPREMKTLKTLVVMWNPNSDCFPFKSTVPLQNSASEAEGAKYLAQVENIELSHKNEAIKIAQLKEGFLKLSEAYVKPANKRLFAFEAQQEVSHHLPDVHSRVASSSIKEASHPPYPSGSYNLATGLPCNEASDNCLTSQLLVIHRQRAAATATVSPSCQPYPSHSLQHFFFHCTRLPDIWRLSSSGKEYEDELSEAVSAKHIRDVSFFGFVFKKKNSVLDFKIFLL